MRSTLHISKRSCLNWMCMAACLVVIQTSCKKDKNTRPDYPVGSNENINTWILDSLKRYYYWTESLPAKPNLSIAPKEFFTSIRSGSDRFSYIILPNDPASYPPSSRGKYGFDYSTVKELNTGQVIGVIRQVLSESPASRNGLKRGDLIRKINGKLLSEANAETLQAELLASNQVSLGLAELSGNSLVDTRSVEVSTGVILDQREISRILESGGRTIGYLNFDTFNPGLAGSLLNVFANFKGSGISDLILDLRYNGGGQVAEAAGLCTLIAGLPYDKPFITYRGNKNGGTRTESIGSAATFDGTVNFSTLLQNNLGLTKVYILGTGATASASEVMINNLKPYIQVILIGEKTRGKDEASFRIFDDRKPKLVDWEMHPIIYKLFNAAGNGGYSNGIGPDISVNELETLPLLPFGDVNDPLIKAALSRITGKTKVALSALKQDRAGAFKIGSVLTNTHLLATENSIVITHR
ncbi:S41 family peptidase [Pedobacter alluvionis]|uniref:C-terminal processing protease CtpA/Prc n=1 Tax=Pedobacter alluvionis TaxID=475253 RepID=A0A497XLN7_9SPHI|nr:S41 family peptidase [Pedobacter alluvionis]RLJ69563.1 C-terminal processing protease CtpA/Prc [Pedobacter alluvionis]TFB28374.1 peptidase S41 [Pedobacter alluvionis]